MPLKSGQTRKGLRNLSTGVVALPESAVAQYDATQETGFSDGNTIGSLTDFINGDDGLTNGTGTYRTNVQNGNPVIRYNGTDEGHYTTSFSLSQPVTFIAVVVDATQGSEDEVVMGRGDSNHNQFRVEWFNGGNWLLNTSAGTAIQGSTTSAPVILTGIFDGSSSVLRENGSQTGSGNLGSTTMESLNIGATDGNGTDFLAGDIGECLVYDGNLDSDGDLSSEENRLAEKWGITI